MKLYLSLSAYGGVSTREALTVFWNAGVLHTELAIVLNLMLMLHKQFSTLENWECSIEHTMPLFGAIATILSI